MMKRVLSVVIFMFASFSVANAYEYLPNTSSSDVLKPEVSAKVKNVYIGHGDSIGESFTFSLDFDYSGNGSAVPSECVNWSGNGDPTYDERLVVVKSENLYYNEMVALIIAAFSGNWDIAVAWEGCSESINLEYPIVKDVRVISTP